MKLRTVRQLILLLFFALLPQGCGILEDLGHYKTIGEMAQERTESRGFNVTVTNNRDMQITLESPGNLPEANPNRLREAYAEIAAEAYAMTREHGILPDLERIHLRSGTTNRYACVTTSSWGPTITFPVESLR